MGLGYVDLDDGDGGGGAGKTISAATAVSCSICLEGVVENGDRSWAKLQCGHQFHLDCIGSAFNVKGAMQCPNCRKIERGQWLYANGSRPLPELSTDDWAHEEDLNDLTYSEISFGVHWCPFSGLTRLPASFDEGDFSPNTYHDLLGRHTVFAEHTPVSSTAHPCPYVSYFGPLHPSSSASNGSTSDGSTYNNHWNSPAVPSEAPSSYAFPSMNVHYHSGEHSLPFATSSRIGGSEQPSVPSLNQRAIRNRSDIPRPGMLPFVVGNSAGMYAGSSAGSSAGRAPSSVTSSMIPPYPGAVTRPRDHLPSVQAYFQQSSSNPAIRSPFISSGRRSSGHRGLAQVVPISSSSDQSSLFFFFSSSSPGRAFHEPENTHRDRFHSWDREHQLSFPFNLNQSDQDSIWGPFNPHTGGSETGRASGFRHRHGSERLPLNRS